MIDRDVQREETYTGIHGIVVQDHAINEGMGPIVDRTFEQLAPSDMMINRVRRMLIKAARAHAKDGTAPASASDPHVYYGIRSGQYVAPADMNWLDAYAKIIAANPVRYPLPDAAE